MQDTSVLSYKLSNSVLANSMSTKLFGAIFDDLTGRWQRILRQAIDELNQDVFLSNVEVLDTFRAGFLVGVLSALMPTT